MPKQDVAVELFYDGAWHDIAAMDDVYADTPIVIMRGQGAESAAYRPASITMKLANDDDMYRPSNPVSPLYGKAGRNTPLRVKVDGTIRGAVEASSWQPDQTNDFRQSPPRGKAWVALQAGGLLQRINQWSQPLRSPLYRAVMLSGVTPAEYWPMEDVNGSGSAVSAVGGEAMVPINFVRYTLPDGSPLPPGGAPDFARGAGITGSENLPNFQGGGTLSSIVRSTTFDGYAIDWVMQFQAGSDNGGLEVADVLAWRETGTYKYFRVEVIKDLVTVFHANAADDATLASTGSVTASNNLFDGASHHFRYQVRQDGGDYRAELYIDSALYGTAENFATPGAMAGTVGRPVSIEWNPLELKGDYMPTSAGHLVIWASGQIGGQPPIFFATRGYAGETTLTRLIRLLDEENIAFLFRGDSGLASTMGPQRSDTLPNLLREIVDTEDGLLFDEIASVLLIFTLRNARYNQTPVLELVPEDLSVPPREVFDDLDVHNVVTAKQREGGDHTARDDTSVLGTQPPPDGVGEYRQTVDVNVVREKRDLPQVANWWLRRGTVNLPRFPKLTIDLAAKPELISAVEAVDIGYVITLTGFREYVIRLYVLGWTEVIGTHTRTITFTCAADQQFQVGEYDDTQRYDSATTTLAVGMTNSQTTVRIGTTNRLETWSTTAVPYPVVFGGELATATAMSATSADILGTETFESGLNDFTASGCTLVQSSAQAHAGTFSALATVTGSPTSATALKDFSKSPFVVPGESYIYRLWVRSPSSLGDVRASIGWYDANGGFISKSDAGTTLAADTWVQREVVADAPEGAVFARYGLLIGSSPTAGTQVYIDDSRFFSTTSLYQTVTLTRSVNGIVKTHNGGEEFHIATPARWGL